MDLNDLLTRYTGETNPPHSVVALKGDASSRRYLRVTLQSGEPPRTLIVMALPDNPMGSDEASGDAVPEELPFLDVGRHLCEAGIRVPEIYLDAVDEGALLIEDLGDRQLADVVSQADETTTLAWYEAAAALLAKMHDRMTPIPSTSIAGARSFGVDLLRWELDHYREWGIEAMFGRLPRAVRIELDVAFDALAEELDALPKGFVHRDYQSRNLMILEERPALENLAVIDFQDAFGGPRIYDLVALLNDSYVALSWEVKHHIIEAYARHRGLDAEHLTSEFHLVTVHRKLKDGARFIFIDRVKHNPAYLGFVDTSFERAKASLNEIPGHERLKSALRAADPTRFG